MPTPPYWVVHVAFLDIQVTLRLSGVSRLHLPVENCPVGCEREGCLQRVDAVLDARCNGTIGKLTRFRSSLGPHALMWPLAGSRTQFGID